MTENQEVKPTTFKVIVSNTVNNVTGVIFEKEAPFEKKDSFMKTIRQNIRDLGLEVNGERVTIRQATVNDAQEEAILIKTITFNEAVVTNKKGPVGPKRGTQSDARKNAADTTKSEADVEILGIATDDTIAEEAAREALMNYPRNQLIHAVNVNREDGEEKLHHFSTKVQAVDKLLSLATVEQE